MNDVVLKQGNEIGNSTDSINSIISRVRESFSKDFVKDVYDKIKLAREWSKIKGEIDKTRDDLFLLEVECIIKMFDMNEKIKGISNPVANFYYDNRNRIQDIMQEFPEYRTAVSLYRAHKRKTETEYYNNYGKRVANGNYTKRESHDEKVNDAAAYEYRNLTSAMTAIMDNLASSEKPFTIKEMADEYISRYEEIDDSIDSNGDLVRGIREVCRETVYSARTTVLGDMKTPKFVTFYLQEENKYMRVPFANAKLWQLDDMILLREKQIQEDMKALKNLKSVRDTISEMSSDEDKTFKDIILEHENK